MKFNLVTENQIKVGDAVVAVKSSSGYDIYLDSRERRVLLGDIEESNILILDEYQGEISKVYSIPNKNELIPFFKVEIQLFTSYHLHTHSEYS